MIMKSKENWNYIFFVTIILVSGSLCIHGVRWSQVTPPEMIEKEGFPAETHLVTSEDGYILSLHRIPPIPGSKRTNRAVFLQHGLLWSSAFFLYNGKNGSIAFLLHQMGYDVWLGNVRGSTFSKMHQNLSTDDPKYWDFSWDEMALYDNPAVISYIHNKTREKLFYIGHSLGCITFAAMAAAKPEFARQKIEAVFALASPIYATHNRQPLFKISSFFWKEILFFTNLLGIHELAGRNVLFDFLGDELCPNFFIKPLCEEIYFSLVGYNKPDWPKDLITKLYGAFPTGTSVRTLVHYFQQESLAKFRHFNYPSAEKNLAVYGSREPPEYNLSKIDVPVAVFCSPNDMLVGTEDPQRFYDEVPNKLGFYTVDPYNHQDFSTALSAPERLFSTIFKLMSQFE